MTTMTDVAVAVITRADGSFLMARRPEGKPYAGYWEFPGGKVEPNESVEDALEREIREELGIAVTRAYPWVTQIFTYPHATVKLHFYRVLAWQGEPHPHEGQIFAWQHATSVDVDPILPANGPILRGLSLPAAMGVTQATAMGEEVFLTRLERALQGGLRLIQVREKDWPEARLLSFVHDVAEKAHAFGARVFLNATEELARAAAVDGVHLSAQRLLKLQHKPACLWCGASCHDARDLAHAAELQLDYVVLGPVLPTATHPGTPTLGWDQMRTMIRDYPLPVFAIGGMTAQHLEHAWQQGAHGIAMLRAAWV